MLQVEVLWYFVPPFVGIQTYSATCVPFCMFVPTTVTVQWADVPFIVAVIVVVPSFFAVTTPSPSIDATDEWVVHQKTLLLFPLLLTVKIWCCPGVKVRLVALSLVVGVFTVILHVYFFFPIFAVMVAFPAFLAVTFPFLLTVATDFCC